MMTSKAGEHDTDVKIPAVYYEKSKEERLKD